MKVINIERKSFNNLATAIALGNFDGVHIGHQKLINSVVSFSRKNNLIAGVLLFENHTRKMIEEINLKLLTTNKHKIELFSNLGIDMVYTAKFTTELRTLPPERFVKDILIDKLNTKSIIVGYDYRFGYKARGNVDLLKTLGEKYDFLVKVIEAQYIDNDIISSTAIRNYLNLGDIQGANIMLGREYSIICFVKSQNKSEKKSCYSKINISTSKENMIPKKGIYITKCKFKDKEYLSITNIITNLYVEDYTNMETYIIGLDYMILNENIEMKFIEFIRESIQYKDRKDLENQIHEDIEYVKSKY